MDLSAYTSWMVPSSALAASPSLPTSSSLAAYCCWAVLDSMLWWYVVSGGGIFID